MASQVAPVPVLFSSTEHTPVQLNMMIPAGSFRNGMLNLCCSGIIPFTFKIRKSGIQIFFKFAHTVQITPDAKLAGCTNVYVFAVAPPPAAATRWPGWQQPFGRSGRINHNQDALKDDYDATWPRPLKPFMPRQGRAWPKGPPDEERRRPPGKELQSPGDKATEPSCAFRPQYDPRHAGLYGPGKNVTDKTASKKTTARRRKPKTPASRDDVENKARQKSDASWEPWLICVQCLDGETVMLQVEASTTIDTVKNMIQEKNPPGTTSYISRERGGHHKSSCLIEPTPARNE